MTILFATAIVILAMAFLYDHVTHSQCKRDRDRYHRQWIEAVEHPDGLSLYVWENADLMPEWEDAYPHVRPMLPERKYSEWATFCANYPTREQMIAQISLDGSARRARVKYDA